MAATRVDLSRVHVVVPNFKKRLSGVTSTIIQLVPLQAKQIGIATLGPGLPDHLPKLRWWQVPGLLRRPQGAPLRVWHARRNPEMLAGVVLRDVFRAPLKLVFTSASQRHHTRWTKFLIRRMDAVIATSRKTAAYLDVPNTVVMHGIDTDRFHPPADRAEAARELGLDPDRLHVGCFGRIRHQKGTDLFVDAMIELLPRHPQWSAVVAGRATPEHKGFEAGLRERVERAGLADRILFVGEHKDIERWYRPLSLFIAPQRWEGFGLTPLEAMASGVPVVATDVGAFSELIEDGVTGTLIPRDDLGAMIAAAGDWMGDETGRYQAAGNGLERARERFVLQGEAEQLVSMYEEMIRL
ncbi:glycosyltransferase family 4 protein [Aquamicrobium defluvii]|uniref:Glycosyl transferase family 1 n=1 Tax=Aquamicrobium defluvii TaxID=69279 RepID=A0A011TG36_9HYPH|nr:glycosyltransferase family 4 protein [Aquamicrobium defluvii]EXL02867.1 glycosyl transferase family 1 [Aquamicrobium defluvii]EZQ13352.1 glycosyl transferase family 1 [Halopseudomonas bauzanensis]TDR33222.1 mannosyltransferase [Aquamicrobium defluvii]